VGIRSFEARYQPNLGDRPDTVLVALDADFFGESAYEATRHYNTLESSFKSKPWCLEFEGKSNKSLEDDRGIVVDGLNIVVDVASALQGGRP
jgi:hypothetical protein